MKKIIVTGGQGFIGSNLVEFLLEKNYFVINIDKSSYSANPYNVKDFKKNKKYIFYKLDINNKNKFLKIIKKYKPDGIFNLAAETHVDRSIDNPYAFLKTNIMGVFNILETLRSFNKINKKLLNLFMFQLMKFMVIFQNINKLNEDYNYNPSSPYSASKAAADQLLKAYFRTYSSKIVIANACNNYGPRQLPEKFIPKIIYNILKNKSIPLWKRYKC